MLATNTNHSLANILSSHKAQKNGNLDIHFPLKLIKQSVSFGSTRKMLSWALIVDPIEMRYAFLNWNIYGIMPIVPTSMTQTLQKRRLCWERPEQQKKIHDSPANGLHPSSEKNLPSFCRNRISMFYQHVYKIQAILYHSANRKRERIVRLQKMFKRASPSCRHQQLPKSPKNSTPCVRHWFLKWSRLAWSKNQIPGMLRYEWSFFLCLWKEGGNLFQKWNTNVSPVLIKRWKPKKLLKHW